jgi:hypothetical protein
MRPISGAPRRPYASVDMVTDEYLVSPLHLYLEILAARRRAYWALRCKPIGRASWMDDRDVAHGQEVLEYAQDVATGFFGGSGAGTYGSGSGSGRGHGWGRT